MPCILQRAIHIGIKAISTIGMQLNTFLKDISCFQYFIILIMLVELQILRHTICDGAKRIHRNSPLFCKGRVTVLYHKWPTFTVKNRL